MDDYVDPQIIDKEQTRGTIILLLKKPLRTKWILFVCQNKGYVRNGFQKLREMSQYCKNAGSCYDNKCQNICKILIDSKEEIPSQVKIKPSEFESPQETGKGMVSGDTINIYETKLGKFSVLICRDFGNFIGQLKDNIDIIFVPSYKPKPDRFSKTAHNHVTDYPSYVIISNTKRS